MAKQSFLMYCDYRQHFLLLSKEQQSDLLMFIFDYVETREAPNIDDKLVAMAFSFIKSNLDRDFDKYDKICNRNRNNGLRGGRPKNPVGYPETQGNPEKPRETQRNPKKPILILILKMILIRRKRKKYIKKRNSHHQHLKRSKNTANPETTTLILSDSLTFMKLLIGLIARARKSLTGNRRLLHGKAMIIRESPPGLLRSLGLVKTMQARYIFEEGEMREIKFRGKDVKTGKWVYGDLQHNEIGDTWISRLTSQTNGEGGLFVNVRPESIGQYTGLKDTNGKEIYEGDIRKGKIRRADKFSSYGDWIYDVYILEKLCSSEYYQKDTKGKLFLKEWDITVDMGIIGNIHDNPELLK